MAVYCSCAGGFSLTIHTKVGAPMDSRPCHPRLSSLPHPGHLSSLSLALASLCLLWD